MSLNFNLLYNNGTLKGWAGPTIAKQAWNLLRHSSTFKKLDLEVPKDGNKKFFIHRIVRELLGKDTPNYPQEIGDCVSFGAKNACEYTQATEKVLKGERQEFRLVFPPYLYGTGRAFVGGGQMGNSDGSTGSWQAEAVKKYGVLAANEPNVPTYSGSIAKRWGSPKGPPQEFVDLAKIHLMKSAALIRSWDDLIAAINNGYPCTVASNQGFNMEASSDGFHRASGSWSHQMCITGVDGDYKTPYALILNSWGDVHGHLNDFEDTSEQLPAGTIRAKRDTIESMIDAGECYAYSALDWFEERKIDKKKFRLIT